MLTPPSMETSIRSWVLVVSYWHVDPAAVVVVNAGGDHLHRAVGGGGSNQHLGLAQGSEGGGIRRQLAFTAHGHRARRYRRGSICGPRPWLLPAPRIG